MIKIKKKNQNASMILTIVFTLVFPFGLIGCDIDKNRDIENSRNIENSNDLLPLGLLEKIHFYQYNEYVALKTFCELEVKISELDIDSTSIIILFNIDLFESTAEGKALREEERYFDITTSHAVIENWIWRWSTGTYAHYETNANRILSEIDFSSEVQISYFSPWAYIKLECLKYVYNDILSFAKNFNVISVSVYAGEEKFEDGNRNGDLDG